ncbi:protein FAM151B [Aphis craccivora]|uniref:Protein FAM151B n=1 Tax=Aphis craccivora TaxID=307492 RepID=A0A6G0YDM7_APHCR|nr:protein FAM151B [Aphis craccivora]
MQVFNAPTDQTSLITATWDHAVNSKAKLQSALTSKCSDELDDRFRLVRSDDGGGLVVHYGRPVRGSRTEEAGAQVDHVRLDGPPRRPEPAVVARRVGGHVDQRPVTRHVRSQGQVRLVLVQQRAHRHPRELVLAHRHPPAAAGIFDFAVAVVGGGGVGGGFDGVR